MLLFKRQSIHLTVTTKFVPNLTTVNVIFTFVFVSFTLLNNSNSMINSEIVIVIDLGSISRFIDNFYMADKCDAVSAYSDRIQRDHRHPSYKIIKK